TQADGRSASMFLKGRPGLSSTPASNTQTSTTSHTTTTSNTSTLKAPTSNTSQSSGNKQLKHVGKQFKHDLGVDKVESWFDKFLKSLYKFDNNVRKLIGLPQKEHKTSRTKSSSSSYISSGSNNKSKSSGNKQLNQVWKKFKHDLGLDKLENAFKKLKQSLYKFDNKVRKLLGLPQKDHKPRTSGEKTGLQKIGQKIGDNFRWCRAEIRKILRPNRKEKIDKKVQEKMEGQATVAGRFQVGLQERLSEYKKDNTLHNLHTTLLRQEVQSNGSLSGNRTVLTSRRVDQVTGGRGG
ncbi:MAG: hypothetical protein J6Y09_08585, partial [Lachnospiraceae bacterium]|nr:hypothetical protein [Lachnospiraceae bacterium]